MRSKSIIFLVVFVLAAAFWSGACTRRVTLSPSAVDLPTDTPTITVTFTSTATPIPTLTTTATSSYTKTATPTDSMTTTVTHTVTVTAAVTDTDTPTVSPSATSTETPVIPGVTATSSPTPHTATVTATVTATSSPTPHALTITTIAGTGSADYSGDGGPATMAGFILPDGMAFDPSGNLYVSDLTANVIRKIDTAGNISTVVGIAAQLSGPAGLAFDSSGNLYFADGFNSVIRRVDTGGTITTFAGNGNLSYSGDGGPALSAEMFYPEGIGFDPLGNLYISDSVNNVVRRVDTGGIITTAAGDGSYGYSGDGGPATLAQFRATRSVAFDAVGNLYISDDNNNRIRKVDGMGTITTFAGNGTYGYSGDGGPATSAELHTPVGMAFDSAGNLYFADAGNNVIRKVDTGGIITTVAGNGNQGYSGDGGPPEAAELSGPQGVAIDAAGNLYITDSYNHVVRKVY